MPHHGTPAGVRAAHGRGARGPAGPALVHRRARPAQVLRHLARPSSRAPSTRACASTARPIDGFSRVQESDVLARPDPNSFELLPWADADGTLGPDVLRHQQPRRHALRGRPPPGAAPQPRQGPRARASASTPPPRWSSSTSPTATPARRRSRSTRRPTSTSPPPTSPATCGSGRSTRSRRWASRWSTATTRTPRASTRSTSATPTPSPWPTTS